MAERRGDSGRSDEGFHVFLLIGQSNMEGVPAPERQDLAENARVQVLAYDDCSALGRTYAHWNTAIAPLHGCSAGVGPGDTFARRMAEAYPEAIIGLVPCAISGVDIDFFRKGVVSSRRNEFRIPPDDHWSGAYEWIIQRAQLAQQVGVIRGILFHQGESDATDPAWPGKVAEVVFDLRTDLGIGESAPFLAGELLHTGCCAAHNSQIAKLPGLIPNAHVISANGLGAIDQYHFDLAGQRELGSRYADTMLHVLTLPSSSRTHAGADRQ